MRLTVLDGETWGLCTQCDWVGGCGKPWATLVSSGSRVLREGLSHQPPTQGNASVGVAEPRVSF